MIAAGLALSWLYTKSFVDQTAALVRALDATLEDIRLFNEESAESDQEGGREKKKQGDNSKAGRKAKHWKDKYDLSPDEWRRVHDKMGKLGDRANKAEECIREIIEELFPDKTLPPL